MPTISEKIKNNPRLKKLIHWMIIPRFEARPRTWIKIFVNPFFHKKGKRSKIRRRTRIDVFPFNTFAIGERTIVEDFCTINNGVGCVEIGNDSMVGIGSVVIGPVCIGNNVIIAQNVVISGLNHGYENIDVPIADQQVKTLMITIADDCWIGANVVITAGVTIGRHTVVAAGSIVTKDVKSFSVVAGNPAKTIKKYDDISKSWIKVAHGD